MHILIRALKLALLSVIILLEIDITNINIILFEFIQFLHKIFVLSLNVV